MSNSNTQERNALVREVLDTVDSATRKGQTTPLTIHTGTLATQTVIEAFNNLKAMGLNVSMSHTELTITF